MKAVLTIFNSKRDSYGNVYYYVRVHGHTRKPNKKAVLEGVISPDNVDTRDCRENLDWYIERQELPIREYDAMIKGKPYLGCAWEDIKAKLTGRSA